MPKLVQINSAVNFSSTGKIVEQIGMKAQSQGWECYVAHSARYYRETHLENISVESIFEENIHAGLTQLFDVHGYGSLLSTWRLTNELEKIKPDIIHLHNIHGYYINYPILFRYLAKSDIPVVWTFHDCWPMTGHCVHYTDENCFKWKEGTCSNCPKKKSYPSAFFLDRSTQNFKNKRKYFTSLNNLTIVPVSYWLGSVVEQSFMGKYPVRVIQNGIDLDVFYPRLEKIDVIREKYSWKNKFVILGVATGWSEEVGLSTFYKLRESLDYRFSIVMVGLTEKQKSELPKGITGILRTQNAEELAEIYSASDVLFNGSFQETFGLVTAEAIACGTPAIVYDSTACPEIVTDMTGRVVPVGDVSKVIDAIISLSELPFDHRQAMTNACINYAKAHFNKEEKYQEYINLYNSLISK